MSCRTNDSNEQHRGKNTQKRILQCWDLKVKLKGRVLRITGQERPRGGALKMGVGGQRHAPAALPPGKTRYIFYRRLGGPQGRSGRVRKISPPPVFDPRTVQPVTSRYTNCALQAHSSRIYCFFYWNVS